MPGLPRNLRPPHPGPPERCPRRAPRDTRHQQPRRKTPGRNRPPPRYRRTTRVLSPHQRRSTTRRAATIRRTPLPHAYSINKRRRPAPCSRSPIGPACPAHQHHPTHHNLPTHHNRAARRDPRAPFLHPRLSTRQGPRRPRAAHTNGPLPHQSRPNPRPAPFLPVLPFFPHLSPHLRRRQRRPCALEQNLFRWGGRPARRDPGHGRSHSPDTPRLSCVRLS